MESIERLLSWAYPIVKKNRVIRNLLLPLRGAVNGALSVKAALFPGAEAPGPPVGHVTFDEWVRERPLGSDVPPASRTEVFPHVQVTRSLPGTVDGEVYWRFRETATFDLPAASVAVVPHGRGFVTGKSSWDFGVVVLTPDNRVLSDFSNEFSDTGLSSREPYLTNPSTLSVFNRERLPAPKKIEGTAALLTVPNGGGYFHWLMQVLPRLELIRRNGIDLKEIDAFVVNICVADFHRETLQAVGVPLDRLVASQWAPHIQADRLIVTTLPFGCLRWMCEFLRDTFLPSAAETSSSGRRIYVSRANTTHRRLVNDREVEAILKRRGFETQHLESMSMPEKAAIMKGAEAVIGPQGGGLTNALFCPSGARLIELFSPRDVGSVFWHMATQCDLEYHYLLGEGPQLPVGGSAKPYAGEDMTIPLDDLTQLLDRLGLT